MRFAKKLFGALLVAAGVSSPLLAEGLLPDIPKGLGTECVADADFMRINHMDLLQHDRDLTVRDGERDIEYSLKECIACHAVNGPDAQPVTIESEEHFCRVCHDYVAVTIDCFQCHNSRPDIENQAGLMGVHADGGVQALTDYLQGVSQ